MRIIVFKCSLFVHCIMPFLCSVNLCHLCIGLMCMKLLLMNQILLNLKKFVAMKKVHHYELGDQVISAWSLESLRTKVFKSEWHNYSQKPFALPLWHGYTIFAVMQDETRIPVRCVKVHPRTRRVTFCRMVATRSK